MKLQTLNVDVAVNAKTMERGLREARQKLQNFGGKGAAFVGGGIGKVGALGSLGGGIGAAAIGLAGAGAAFMAPFKLGGFVVESFAEATDRARKAVEAYEQDFTKNIYRMTGVSEVFARRLAEGADAAELAAASQKGWMDTFWGAMADKEGRLGGAGGWVQQELGVGGGGMIKEAAAFWGAIIGGKSWQEAGIEREMATATNPASLQQDLDDVRRSQQWLSEQAAVTRRSRITKETGTLDQLLQLVD
jgi:hypothetical protein